MHCTGGDMADPIPEAPQRAPMDGTHRPGSDAALVAASRWVGQSVAVPRDEQGRVVRHAHLYDPDSHYNPTHHVEQMEGEGDLSLLLHHKLSTNARSEAALVEYYGEDHRKGSSGGSRALPWEERTRKEAEWKAGIRKDAVSASPAAGVGPAASPARRSSRSFVSDANGVMLLGEDAETFARRAGAWSTRTPTRAATGEASIQNRGQGAGGSARSQLSPGVGGSTAGSGLSGGLRRNASRTPRPSPSTRAVPWLADSKPDEDLCLAEEETAFMLGQAYKLGLGGMLENRQQVEDAEALALALATKGNGKHQHEDRGLRLHQAPPVRHHVRQPQPRQMDWTLTEGHGGARAVHDKDNKDLLPRRHKPHLLRPPSHARSLAAQSETINHAACEMSALVIAGDSAAGVGGSPLSSPRGRSVRGRSRGRSSPDGAMKELEQLRRKLQGLSYSHQGQEPKKLFATFDRNNSGELDEEEFRLAVRKGGRLTAAMLDDQSLSKLFRAIDIDGNGTIEIDELTSWVWDDETALRLRDQRRADADKDALAFIRRDSTAHGNDNAVRTRQTAATPAKAKNSAAGSGRSAVVSTGAHNLLSDEEYDKASELDYTLRPARGARSDVGFGSSPGMSARERGRQANERHRAELEARKLKRHAALAQKQALVAREHSEQLARASALALRETRGRLEREASIAAEDEMRLYRARLAVTRWKQRLVRSWLIQWRNNALWQKKLLKAWGKLQVQITARYMRDGFHAWAHFISVKKRSKVLLLHALRRWRNDRLRETFFSWLSYITYSRRVAQALDRTAGRRRQTTMRLTFFGWCETMADERRSRWLASRVESNSCKRLLSLTLGYWRIEARALARAAAKKKQEADALERARAREADRLAVLNNVAELVSKRRNTSLSQSKTLSLADAGSSDGPSVEAVAEAVVEDLAEQEREAALQQLAMEQAEAKNMKKRKKRTKDGGFACCSRPSRQKR